MISNMKNREVAKLLYDIADLLEIRGEMIFMIRAYRRAAQAVEAMPTDVGETWKQGKLDSIPGVGRGIAEKIDEYLKKGRLKYLDELKKGLPPGFADMLAIEGVGPKKVKLFYEKLGIKNLEQLEKAAKSGKLRKIPSLKEKTEQNIIRSIEASKKRGGRMLLGHALTLSDEIINEMKKCKDIRRIDAAGSLRRMKETIGDIDILASSEKPDSVIKFFTKMSMVARVIATGPTKASVNLFNGIQVDLRALPEKEYGSALLYFTGSKEHNIEMRKIAISRRLKLSEYGLFSGKKVLAGRTEQDVYRCLGMDYIEPEMRENRGELEAAKRHELPGLVGYEDIKGDLHMHTKWSDGSNTVEEMANAAGEMGYEYICISDHIGKLAIARAMDKKRVEQQSREIEKVRKKSDIQILHGGEIDIGLDGKFAVPDAVLRKLDIVTASLHSGLKGDGTQRILSAMENPNVDIIGHMSGRLIDRRDGVRLDITKITEKAAETNMVLEINSQPERLDMNDVNTKAAIGAGCFLAVNTDAHSIADLRYMRIGVATARRGWAPKSSVINSYPLEKMKKCLKG